MSNNVLILVSLYASIASLLIILMLCLFNMMFFFEKYSKFYKRMFYILGSFDSDPFSAVSHKNIKNYIKLAGFNKKIENYLLVVFSPRNVQNFNKRILACKGDVKLKKKLIKEIIPSSLFLAFKVF